MIDPQGEIVRLLDQAAALYVHFNPPPRDLATSRNEFLLSADERYQRHAEPLIPRQ